MGNSCPYISVQLPGYESYDTSSNRNINCAWAADISVDGHVVIAGSDGSLKVWNLIDSKRGAKPTAKYILQTKADARCSSVVISEDAKIVVATHVAGADALVWHVADGVSEGVLKAKPLREAGAEATHSAPVQHCAISDCGRVVVTASDDKTVKVWHTQRVHGTDSVDHAHMATLGEAGTSDGGADDALPHLMDEAGSGGFRNCAVTPIPGEKGSVRVLMTSLDAFGSHETSLWDIEVPPKGTGPTENSHAHLALKTHCIMNFPAGYGTSSYGMVFSHDHDLCALHGFDLVICRSALEPEVRKTMEKTKVSTNSTKSKLSKFCPHGRKKGRAAPEVPGRLRCVALSPNGAVVATAARGSIKLFLLRRRPIPDIMTLSGHGSDILCIRFSADGTILMSVDDAGELRVWQLPDAIAKECAADGVYAPAAEDSVAGKSGKASSRTENASLIVKPSETELSHWATTRLRNSGGACCR
jgi:WD40 repeat protein